MYGSIVAFRSGTALPKPAGAGFGQQVRAFVTSAVREWKLRREMRRLEEFDTATLGDIGITPGGIEGAVRYGRSRRSAASLRPLGLPPVGGSNLMPASWTEWR
jgi:uncharacterized protein YjiS (DUF1127 family)